MRVSTRFYSFFLQMCILSWTEPESDYTSRPRPSPMCAFHTCTYLPFMHHLAVASVAGRPVGDIEVGTGYTTGRNRKTHWEITGSWQRCLEEKENVEKDKLRQETLMVSREGKTETEYKRQEEMSDWENKWWMRLKRQSNGDSLMDEKTAGNGEIKRDRWLDEWRQLDFASATLFFCLYGN